MRLSQQFSQLIKSNFSILATSLLAFLLIILEKLMETEFTCPSNRTLGVWYSCAFFFLPILVLIALSLKYTAGIRCSRPCRCSCPGFLCDCFQVSVAPLLWFLILLTDGRYLSCLLRSATGSVTPGVKEISQIVGLCLITLWIIIVLVIPNLLSKCESSYIGELKKYYFRKQHEGNVLYEVENTLQKDIQGKIRDYVKTNVSKVLSKIKADNPDAQKELLEIIWMAKETIKTKLETIPPLQSQ